VGLLLAARWLLGDDPAPAGGLDRVAFPALLPHYWDLVGHSIVPFFPPGFPLLLAIADALGLLLAVPAIVGATTVWLAYLLVRRECGGTAAVALAAAWATTPIVLWGATHLMSDLVAAAGSLGAYYLIRTRRPGWSGAVTAFSILVRPSNVAFGLVMATFGTQGRARLRYSLASALGVGTLVAVFWHRYGSLSRVQYFVANVVVLRMPARGQLVFLLWETLRGSWPLMLLSLVAIIKTPARALVPCAWFLAFLLPYSMWPFAYEDWWWARYLLPALPAVLDLAAVGLRERQRASPAVERAAVPVVMLASLATCWEDARLGALTSSNDAGWRSLGVIVAENTPRDALVGTRSLAEALHVYAERVTFAPFGPRATALARYALERRQPVYLVEDENSVTLGFSFAEWHRSFALEHVFDITPSDHLFRVRMPDGSAP